MKSAESDAKLAERLGLRLDIPLQLLRQLLARATDRVRSWLLAAATPDNREQIEHALESIAKEVGQEAAGLRNLASADSLVYQLNRHGKLTEAVLVEFINQGKYEEMTATLALFCGAKSDLIERILKNISHEGIIVVCKAAKLSWATVRLILEVRFSHHVLSQQELDAAKDAFLELSQTVAQRSMRFMQVQDTARKVG